MTKNLYIESPLDLHFDDDIEEQMAKVQDDLDRKVGELKRLAWRRARLKENHKNRVRIELRLRQEIKSNLSYT